MTELTDALLQEMLDVIIKAVNPRQIVLFGSYARGTAGPNSDLDFLIVKDEPFVSGKNRRKEMAKVWQFLAHYPIPQDVLIYSQDEVNRWRNTKNHIISQAYREGKVIYERV